MATASSNPSSITSAGAWSTTTNVYSSNDTYATNTGSTQNTEYPFDVSGFDFNGIPSGSTINSCTVTIEAKTGTVNRAQIKGELYDSTTAISGTLALTNLTAADANYTFTPTPTLAQLKSSTLLVRVTNKRIVSQASTTSVDYVKIDVDYTVPGNYAESEGLTDSFSAVKPLSAWHFDEGSGTTSADVVDSRNATVTTSAGATWVTGHTGNAVQAANNFDSGVIYASLTGMETAKRTMMFWGKAIGTGIHYGIRMQNSGGSGVWGILITGTNGDGYSQSRLKIGGSNYDIQVTNSSYASWCHYASTYDGATHRFYINGVQVGTPVSISGTIDAASGVFDFCENSAQVDDVRMFDGVLQAQDIKLLMNTPVPSGAALTYSASDSTGLTDTHLPVGGGYHLYSEPDGGVSGATGINYTPITVGTEFTVTQRAWLRAVRFYVPPSGNMSLARKMGIWGWGGGADANANWTQVGSNWTMSLPNTASTWNEYRLPNGIQLTASTKYRVGVWTDDGEAFTYVEFYFSTGPGGTTVTRGGFLVRPNQTDSLENEQGSYQGGSTPTVPLSGHSNAGSSHADVEVVDSPFFTDSTGLVDSFSTVHTPGGGGLTHSTSDTVNLTDTETSDSVSNPSTDAVTLTDTETTEVGRNPTADAVGITDASWTVERVLALTPTADTAGVTDPSRTFLLVAVRGYSDTAGVTDISAEDPALAPASDSENITDSAYVSLRSFADAVGVTDTFTTSTSGALTVSATDAAGTTDTAQMAASEAVSDVVGVTDLEESVSALNRLDGSAGITDLQIARDFAENPVTETAGVTDTVTELVTLDRQDSENVTDTYTVPARTYTDPVGITDAVETTGAGSVNRTDSAGVTDSISFLIPRTRNYSDTVGITDTSVRATALDRIETVTLTDLTTRAMTKARSELAGITDTRSAGLVGIGNPRVAPSFDAKPGLYWTGTQWLEKPWLHWTGTEWKAAT